MKSNVIVDLDGTLALDDARRPLIPSDGFAAYFEALNSDVCNEVVKNLMCILKMNGAKVIIITARPDMYRFETERWLTENGVIYDEMHMRPEGTYNPDAFGSSDPADWTPDSDVKTQMLLDNELTIDNVELCLDDKDSMVAWWRDQGFVCLQVRNEGTFY